MNDRKIKELAAHVLRNKDTIYRLLTYLRPEDIEQGILSIPDRMLNEELRPAILAQAGPYLTNYRLTCSGSNANSINGSSASSQPSALPGLLFLDAELCLKQLGKIQARYMISLSQLSFSADPSASRKVVFSYREDVKSVGNPLQAIALKAFLGNDTLLMKAAALSGFSSSLLAVTRQTAAIDLSRSPIQLPSFLDAVNLECQGIGEGFIRFRFDFK